MSTTTPPPDKREWSSPFSGWVDRAHPCTHDVDFRKATLLMASTYSVMDGSGLNLALWELDTQTHVVFDSSSGRTWELDATDAAGLKTLMEQMLALRERYYTIEHEVTCLPIDLVRILTRDSSSGLTSDRATKNGDSSEGDTRKVYKLFTVYGYFKGAGGKLNEEGNEQLPVCVDELFGLIGEHRSLLQHTSINEEQSTEEKKMERQRLAKDHYRLVREISGA